MNLHKKGRILCYSYIMNIWCIVRHINMISKSSVDILFKEHESTYLFIEMKVLCVSPVLKLL